jgi:hypothetical protein
MPFVSYVAKRYPFERLSEIATRYPIFWMGANDTRKLRTIISIKINQTILSCREAIFCDAKINRIIKPKNGRICLKFLSPYFSLHFDFIFVFV